MEAFARMLFFQGELDFLSLGGWGLRWPTIELHCPFSLLLIAAPALYSMLFLIGRSLPSGGLGFRV